MLEVFLLGNQNSDSIVRLDDGLCLLETIISPHIIYLKVGQIGLPGHKDT